MKPVNFYFTEKLLTKCRITIYRKLAELTLGRVYKHDILEVIDEYCRIMK